MFESLSLSYVCVASILVVFVGAVCFSAYHAHCQEQAMMFYLQMQEEKEDQVKNVDGDGI
jgi:hypothetical protein